MREIKFRAWTKAGMVESILNQPYGLERFFGFLSNEGAHSFDGVMQYTGLKDKNGKEIYEGDIVRTESVNDFKNKVVEFGEVSDASCTHQGFGLAEVKYYSTPHELHRILGWKHTEVIGNIYENPELLEDL